MSNSAIPSMLVERSVSFHGRGSIDSEERRNLTTKRANMFLLLQTDGEQDSEGETVSRKADWGQ